jgi:hypothetical protein
MFYDIVSAPWNGGVDLFWFPGHIIANILRMNRKSICLVLFFGLCVSCCSTAYAQTVADAARKAREKKQQIAPDSTPGTYTNGDMPHGWTSQTPSSSESPENTPYRRRSGREPVVSPSISLDPLPTESPSESPSEPPKGSPMANKLREHRAVYGPLFLLSAVLTVVGGFWVLIVAFRTGLLWGLGCLFIPFVELIFVVTHWEEAKRPFLLQVIGIAILVALGMTLS